MASTSIGSLVVNLIAETAQFRADLNRASNDFKKFASSVQSAARTFAVSLGAGLTVRGIVNVIEKSLEAADALDEMSTRIGIGVERLQELQYAAKLSGVSAEQLEQGLTILNRRIGEAAAGAPEAAGNFRDMGIAIRDANGNVLDAGQILPDIADKLKNAASATERGKITFDAFGKSGNALQPMLIGGAVELEKFAAKARELGIVMDRYAVAQAVKAKDAFDTLSTVIGAKVAQAVVNLAPALVTLADELQKTTLAAAEFWSTWLNPSGEEAVSQELAKEIANLARLRKELKAIQEGGGIGSAINRAFGQDKNFQAAIDASEERIKNMRAQLRQSAADRVSQNVPAKTPTGGVGLSDAQLKALDAFREKLVALQNAGNPVAQSLHAIDVEVEKLKEMGVAGKEVDRVASAMRNLITTQATNKDWVAQIDAQEELDLALLNTLAALNEIRRAEQEAGEVAGRADFVAAWVAVADAIEEADLAALRFAEGETDAAIKAVAENLRESNAAWVEQAEAVIKATEADLAHKEAQADVLRGLEEQITGLQMTGREAAIYAEQLKLGADASEELRARTAALAGQLYDLKKQQAESQKFVNDLTNVVINTTLSFSDALIDMAATGKASWGDLATSAIKDITRIIQKLLILQAVESGIRALKAWWGGGADGAIQLSGPSATGAAKGAYVKHSSGGSLMWVGEGGKDEAIIPLDRMGELGGNVNINFEVHNYSNESVSATRERSGDGTEVIKLVIGANKSATARGDYDDVFRNRYGLVPTRGGR